MLEDKKQALGRQLEQLIQQIFDQQNAKELTSDQKD